MVMTGLLTDPIDQLRLWYAEAEAHSPGADVVALATASADAKASVRMVNFKGWRGDCLSFFTNYESRKGRDLAANPRAAMLFYWPALKRQVQVEGECVRMSESDSRAYFATRDREAQLSAHMSHQSRELESFELMERRIHALRERFRDDEIPCPPYWGGYLLRPARIEFRIGREHRRHWRWEFVRTVSGWQNRKLFP
jgi:pyridoxamine 5'-phosphate oxidase